MKFFRLNKATAAIFLEIKSTYDNVLIDVLIIKLVKLSIPSNTLHFIYNLTSSRQLHCRYKDIDEITRFYKGLPRGNVLSPMLYF